MKILAKKTMYVQKQDLEFLNFHLHTLPHSIQNKIFNNGNIDLDDYGKYDFLEFKDEEDINYFQGLDWLIDYNEVRHLSFDELKQIGENYVSQLDEVSKHLYSISSKDETYKDTLKKYTILNFQINTLTDICDIKNDLLKINIPSTKTDIQKLIKSFLSKLAK